MDIKMDKVPRHVAVIMDGNGRWASAHGQERLYGHRSGVDSVRDMVKRASDIGVEYLTIYAFSTENWGRPQTEVYGLMQLISYTIMQELEPLTKSGVKLSFIGDVDALPQDLRQSIEKAEQMEVSPVKLNLVIALNYSSRAEITSAVKQISEKVCSGALDIQAIDQQMVSNHLYTKNMPDPELLIRTSGEQRLSNFLLWQLSYSELYFTDLLWPDFTGEEFSKAIEQYQRRDRRFGLVK